MAEKNKRDLARTRRLILEAASEEFAEHGLQGAMPAVSLSATVERPSARDPKQA